MNWSNVYEATAANAKLTPGWQFKSICQEAQQFPQEVPDLAEHLMQCCASGNRTVAMKACLTIRHLADDVPEFRTFMQRCPEALHMLGKLAEPPQLAQARALERPDLKVEREAAARAVKSILFPQRRAQEKKANLQNRIQGFGNFEPPPDEEEKPRGVADSVLGFVGDAVADTVDDFREKGAIGAVRDGVADAADLILDGVGAVWGFLGGRKARQAQAAAEEKRRICQPVPEGHVSGSTLELLKRILEEEQNAGAGGGGAAPDGAFGNGAVGAKYAMPVLAQQQQFAPAGYPAASAAGVPAAPAPATVAAPAAGRQEEQAAAPLPMSFEDLLSFDDDLDSADQSQVASAVPCADLLDFGDGAPASASAPSGDDLLGTAAGAATGPAAAERLKTEGNNLVREKKYAEAIKAYDAALEAMAGEATMQNSSVPSALHANIALCNLQQQLYRRAVEAATKSIELDPTYAKAYYRRCLAYKALKMPDEARKDLEALQFCRHDMSPVEMQRLCHGLALG